MTAFTDNMPATALRLLTKYGEAVSLSRVTEGSYDVSNGTVAAGSTTNYTGYGAPVDYIAAEIDGTVIQQGDVRLLLNQTSTEPAVGDTCTLNSIVYRVVNVDRSRASGVNIIYKLQLRK